MLPNAERERSASASASYLRNPPSKERRDVDPLRNYFVNSERLLRLSDHAITYMRIEATVRCFVLRIIPFRGGGSENPGFSQRTDDELYILAKTKFQLLISP